MTQPHLRVGLKLRLPSGNCVVLVALENDVWVCEFTALSTRRGRVEFSAVWLLKHCREC